AVSVGSHSSSYTAQSPLAMASSRRWFSFSNASAVGSVMAASSPGKRYEPDRPQVDQITMDAAGRAEHDPLLPGHQINVAHRRLPVRLPATGHGHRSGQLPDPGLEQEQIPGPLRVAGVVEGNPVFPGAGYFDPPDGVVVVAPPEAEVAVLL